MKTSTGIAYGFALGATLGLGITVIYLQLSSKTEDGDTSHEVKVKYDEVRKIVMDEMSTERLEKNLRKLAGKPHIAGRDVDEVELVNFISDSWKNSGLDVEIHPYNVLLDYPDDEDPNYVAIKNEDGTENFVSHFNEKILDESQNVSGIVKPYNAYSPPGDPEGELVYVHFGRLQDFTTLTTKLGIDPSGKICIVRGGRIFRGNKEKYASMFGCVGLIVYTDPQEYTVKGKGVYPDDWYLPGSAARRGAIFQDTGDPLTLNYPSIESSWRANVSDIEFPKIPVIPIGYDDGRVYLSRMAGPEAPKQWQGGLNISYRLGPGFSGGLKTSKMRMHVTNKLERKTVHNVIGYIKGAVEPDRYVMFGNHRDAWVFGALDPSSGTAVMVEVVRTFGLALKKGWRPRRTMVFCNWGGEEFGFVGSTEWVEEFQKILQYRTVAYVNIDSSVVGIYSLYGRASPNLKQLLFDSAATIPNPNQAEAAVGLKTLFDAWKLKIPRNQSDPNTEPLTLFPGLGSDYAPFTLLTGISIMDFAYVWDVRLGLDFYPVYHTVYETLDLMTTFLDPNFVYHQAVGRLWGEVALRLTESSLLPFNCIDYVAQIKSSMNLVLSVFGEALEAGGIDTDLVQKSIDKLMTAAVDFHERLEKIDLKDQLALRAANDQLMQFERAFIDIQGITGLNQERHVVFSPSRHDATSALQFPGLVDSIVGIENDPNQRERWQEVQRQYSILIYHFGSAASTLRDFTPFIGESNMARNMTS